MGKWRVFALRAASSLILTGGGVGVCCSIYSVQGCRSSISNLTLLTIFTQIIRFKMSCIVIYQLNLTLWENSLRSDQNEEKNCITNGNSMARAI